MDTLSQDRPRVLIVDDQPNWLEVLCEVLEPTLYEIETATNYDEAKRKLRQRAFHVVVTDQRLVDGEEANIEGILLLDEVAKLQDGTETIVVTGYPKIDAIRKAFKGYDALDYILKRPEDGGPFNIRQYRERVEEAAKKAMEARRKATTLDFSLSALVTDLTYDRIAEILLPEGTVAHDVPEGHGEVLNRLLDTLQPSASQVRKVLARLLYPLQPLVGQMGRAWLSESEQICEILCWSRNQGKAALVRIGREQRSLDAYRAKWFKKGWRLSKSEQFSSPPLVGVSYTINEMTFEDFAALVEEE